MPVQLGQSSPKSLCRIGLATTAIHQFNICNLKFQQCVANLIQRLWKIVFEYGQRVIPGLYIKAALFEFLKIQGVVIAELYE